MNDAVNKSEPSDIRPREYTASIYCSEEKLAPEFVKGIQHLQSAIGRPVWMLVQRNGGLWKELYDDLFDQRMNLPSDGPVALLIDSPGGDARTTYKIAKLLIACSGGYIALVPQFAKSAATLLTLGAKKIVLGTHGELGPLDVQVDDPELEHTISALDHVQTLEQLSTFALQTLDQAVFLTLARSSKRISSVLPLAMEFSCALARPLMEGIDTVKYTEMSRMLRVGKAYAERLLRPHYGDAAVEISRRLVSDYPEHGFVIDHDEAKQLGLRVELPEGEVAEAFTKLLPYMDNLTAIGALREIGHE